MKAAEFQRILEEVLREKQSSLTFTADGVSYTRNFRPRERLILLGGGHISREVCRFASELDFAVTVADDRPEFSERARFPEAEETLCAPFPIAIARLGVQESDYVAVVTRGHSCDADCLRSLLAGPQPRYLGMIGSRRRVAGLMRLLGEEGFPRDRLAAVNAPIGLDIGALTVREIAISILAQLIAFRRKDTCRRPGSGVLVTENAEAPLLRLLADEKRRKCLLLVLETSGSTPVKSGAMMALDEDYRTAGTIGGGCSESQLLSDAYFLIGTGREVCAEVNLSNDVAAREGMVCGGTMKVLLADVTGAQAGDSKDMAGKNKC